MDLAQGFHSRLTHDVAHGALRDGAIRYLMVRPDVLMGLFARLDPAVRVAALQALGRSVTEFGGRSVAAYRDAGAADPEAMMDTMVTTSAALGWGRWRFTPQPDGAVEVQVENSPFAEGLAASGPVDAPCCAPIAGMLTAIAPLIVGEGATAHEVDCAAVEGGDTCRFVVMR